MNIFETRRQGESFAEKRFINKVLKQEAGEIKQAQGRILNRFRSSDWRSKQDFKVQDNTMTYRHLAKHRFVDMRRRMTAKGRIKKKNHSVHNRILYGHANNIVRELTVGFTQEVKEQMSDTM